MNIGFYIFGIYVGVTTKMLFLWLAMPILATSCIIDIKQYPEVDILEKHKDLILGDLESVLEQPWFRYDSIDIETFYSRLYASEKNGFKSLEGMQSKLNEDKLNPAWRSFVLKFNGKFVPTQLTHTIDILKNISGVKHAGFSCFEPGAISKLHIDANLDTYRLHFPLVIPEGDCKFQLGGKIYSFDQPRVFDDSCAHRVWNKTNKNRHILILDIYRKQIEL